VKFVAPKKGMATNYFSPLSVVAVFGSGIRDPGWVKIRIRDPRYTSRIRNTAFSTPLWFWISLGFGFRFLQLCEIDSVRSSAYNREQVEWEANVNINNLAAFPLSFQTKCLLVASIALPQWEVALSWPPLYAAHFLVRKASFCTDLVGKKAA
jgi:hypothetical protein